MYLLQIKIEEMIKECPFVTDWIDLLNKHIKKSNFPISKIEGFYDYGFFVPASKNTPEHWALTISNNMDMNFEERLESELAKVRVTVTIKLGHTVLTHKLPKGTIPTTVKDIIGEITKIRMGLECDEHGNEEIRSSIPPLRPDIVIEFIDNTPKEEPEFEIDDLLDKINNSGFESLSQEEKQFLDRKSKDL